MYEPLSHSILNHLLDRLKPEIRDEDLHHFYTRLGGNFYSIYGLFSGLYKDHPEFEDQLLRLVETMARQYILRSDEQKQEDLRREKDYNWFLDPSWTGMTLYADGFADDLKGVTEKIFYFQELGVNLVHIMPMLTCPEDASDGGYAVSNYREVDPRLGAMEDLDILFTEMKKRDILTVLDVVVNHTSDEHEWAARARTGDETYQNYYYMFENRDVPEMFEASLPEIFPQTAPGNFTWDEESKRWVMTVFNNYQWDLNYTNPAVFIEMLDILLFWANKGADILRLDAVAFLWKKIGSNSQNEREAHMILQLFKDCCQVTAPGLLFIAEAIVAPVEIVKYFGEDAVNAKECEIAYNATFMALLWDAVATKNARLLYQGLQNLPDKLEGATWLNYIRCHDDIGLGFTDTDIAQAGYEPKSHRDFLIRYFTGDFENSDARGLLFGHNNKTNDARISGTLTSLIGLEKALEEGDDEKITETIEHIILLYNVIFSFGGIPLIYYGDEIGTLNDYSYIQHLARANDSRWAHRPRIDWEKAERRKTPGTVEYRIFATIKKMISARARVPAFSDFNNRELLPLNNDRIFAFTRTNPMTYEKVLAISNFEAHPQYLEFSELERIGFQVGSRMQCLFHGRAPDVFNSQLVLPAYGFYWLANY